MSEDKMVVEVNGVKLEVDLRTAKRIDTLRIGDRVKCLVKEYSEMKTYPGVVVGFEPFKSLPSIVVAYLSTNYNSTGLNFKTFNAKTEDFEIVADLDQNALEVDKAYIITMMDREIDKKREELAGIEAKKKFFLDKFGTYFQEGRP